MSFVSKLAELLKAFDRKVWPDHRVVISSPVAEVLGKDRIIVADVGSAGGAEEIWLSLLNYIHFLTFDPNPRPNEFTACIETRTTNFPIGLWSEKCEKDLYITAHPDSSSLMPINTELFSEFISKEGMEMVDKTSLKLDTLDNLLAGKPELTPDFLKVDVEGADLEVLKGARQALDRSVLGLKVETAFLELHIGAPLLWEVDNYLREQGFVLFHLGRNHWVRNNHLLGYSSNPQLILGDAIYFLSHEKVLQRLSQCTDSRRKAIMTKFVILLVRHGVHDYSWDLVEKAANKKFISAEYANVLRSLVTDSMDTSVWYLVKGFLGVLFSCGILLASLPLKEPRKRGVYYVKQRAGRFFYDLYRRTALTGRARHANLGDSLV